MILIVLDIMTQSDQSQNVAEATFKCSPMSQLLAFLMLKVLA